MPAAPAPPQPPAWSPLKFSRKMRVTRTSPTAWAKLLGITRWMSRAKCASTCAAAGTSSSHGSASTGHMLPEVAMLLFEQRL